MPRIAIEDAGVWKSLTAAYGENLYSLLAAQGLSEGPCGGQGRCGKCRVRFLSPPPAFAEEKVFFSPAELTEGWRLACLHRLEADTALVLPQQEKSASILLGGYAKTVTADGEPGYGLAVDIGTTTVAASLLQRDSGRRLAGAACLNSQKIYGQDVISRIDYAQRQPGGLADMRQAILGDIRRLLLQACQEAHVDCAQVQAVTVAANTVMTHIFGGVDPACLAAYPFTPGFTGPLRLSARQLDLPLAPETEVFCLPAVSAYVGGDITAGLLTCSVPELPGCSLFIDIGTNGEMVLCREGKMVSCSCAAGPALEGMSISCGMRAAAGAIEDVCLRYEETGPYWHCQTIDGGEPQGLCGSGLLSAVAQMAVHGVIGENGRLQQNHPLVETVDGRRRCPIHRRIFLSQQDIRQVQLAKGAVLAGIRILLQESGVQSEQVDRVLVAGQFGAHLSGESLIGAGLLPAAFAGKIHYVGNTSLAGAELCLISQAERQRSQNLFQNIRYLELSVWPDYEQALMKAMRFQRPHGAER